MGVLILLAVGLSMICRGLGVGSGSVGMGWLAATHIGHGHGQTKNISIRILKKEIKSRQHAKFGHTMALHGDNGYCTSWHSMDALNANIGMPWTLLVQIIMAQHGCNIILVYVSL